MKIDYHSVEMSIFCGPRFFDKLQEFCDKLNKSALNNVKTLSALPHICDVNSYFVNRKVKCLYKLNLTCETVVLNSLKDGELTEYAFATYVELIDNDDSVKDKKNKYITLLTTFANNNASEEISVLLSDRIDDLQQEIENNSDKAREIILNYTLLKLSYAGYLAYKTIGENMPIETTYKNIYEETKVVYNSLVNSIM